MIIDGGGGGGGGGRMLSDQHMHAAQELLAILNVLIYSFLYLTLGFVHPVPK